MATQKELTPGSFVEYHTTGPFGKKVEKGKVVEHEGDQHTMVVMNEGVMRKVKTSDLKIVVLSR